MSKKSMRDMLEAGIHFGHQTCNWNPKMARYIFGERNKIHIINLEKTIVAFRGALNFVGKLISGKNNTVLFVGTKRAARKIIREQAQRCGMPYVDYRWLGGMLTNYKTIRQSIRRLRRLTAQRDEGLFERLTKKEALMNMRQLEKLEQSLGGIKDMGGLPDALFIVDVHHEKIAVQEANRLNIPTIGVVDTNSSPDCIDYVIPGNDDGLRAIELYASSVADAILESRAALTTGTEEEPVVIEKNVVTDKIKTLSDAIQVLDDAAKILEPESETPKTEENTAEEVKSDGSKDQPETDSAEEQKSDDNSSEDNAVKEDSAAEEKKEEDVAVAPVAEEVKVSAKEKTKKAAPKNAVAEKKSQEASEEKKQKKTKD